MLVYFSFRVIGLCSLSKFQINMDLDLYFLEFSFQVVKLKLLIHLSPIHHVVSWLLMSVLDVFYVLPTSPFSKSTLGFGITTNDPIETYFMKIHLILTLCLDRAFK